VADARIAVTKAPRRCVIAQEGIMGLRRCAVVVIAVVSQSGPTLGQTSPGMAPSYTGGSSADYERQQREYWRAQEAERMEQQRRQQMNDEQRRRDEEASKRNFKLDGGTPSPGGAPSYGGSQTADMRALGKEMLRLPPLPAERNVLLGSWSLEGGGPKRGVAEFGLTGRGATLGFGEMMGMLADIESGKMLCEVSFGRGITFTPTTFSSGGAAGIAEGPVAYRSRNKKVIVAIPGDSRANPMPFTIAGPNRIVWADTCTLVRVGTPTANAATNLTAVPGNTRTAAAGASAAPPNGGAVGGLPQGAAVAPAPPPSTLSRPSAGVCRNTLLDKLGTVGVNQVRAMSDARFKEPAIEGKVPNTNNLRIDLRGSACDDPRIKATLYDFDADGLLQSITYVWERPAGPAPAPIFAERVTTLSRLHPSLPPPQSTGRLQGDTSLGRLVLQDLPERNLLLEAYKATPK
jgi:hypothetical protein